MRFPLKNFKKGLSGEVSVSLYQAKFTADRLSLDDEPDESLALKEHQPEFLIGGPGDIPNARCFVEAKKDQVC